MKFLKDMQKYKVPLLTDISSISKNDVDVACVVINSTLFGGKGSQIVEYFLKKESMLSKNNLFI